MKRKGYAVCLAFLLLLTGCTLKEQKPTQYQATFLDVFDTVTTIVGYAESEEAFQAKVQPIHEELMEYHQLFDIYQEYDGITNLKTINDQAGKNPVTVDEKIIELLIACREFYEMTDGKVNIAMGSVLSLWHDAREKGNADPKNAVLPEEEALKEAAMHTAMEDVIIDEEKNTVFLQDSLLSLDVGAIAKGFAAQKVTEEMEEGMLLSVGGNVCASGPKDDEGTPWIVGIENPDSKTAEYLHTLMVTEGCVVTSGDYQRVYTVDGEKYHHIIDPQTLYPSAYWSAVTIVCMDSGVADMLSTALFLMPMEEGEKLLQQFDAEAMWVSKDGEQFYSSGFATKIRT